jgi:hypothetical protein
MSSSVLADFLKIKLFAQEVERHPRTVKRWTEQPRGLPYTKMGKEILIHVPTARQWLLDEMQNQKHRPRKRARRRT